MSFFNVCNRCYNKSFSAGKGDTQKGYYCREGIWDDRGRIGSGSLTADGFVNTNSSGDDIDKCDKRMIIEEA